MGIATDADFGAVAVEGLVARRHMPLAAITTAAAATAAATITTAAAVVVTRAAGPLLLGILSWLHDTYMHNLFV
jgi:hypothetical protein